MSPEVVRRAIEPFFTTKGLAGGNGLGLSTVYGFAQQSGGCLTITSKPRRGTTVRLYLPRAADAIQGPLPLAAARTEPTASHVLLVEDDLLVRSQAGRLLAGLGYRVTVADDGPSALAALDRADDISLLMTDMVMPGGMNGRELAMRARRNRPSLKVLLTSGYTEEAAPPASGPDTGAGFLPKPYRRAQLAEAVSAALSRPQPFLANRASTRQSHSERPAQ
jgi:CheY-like chemotaxis protein